MEETQLLIEEVKKGKIKAYEQLFGIYYMRVKRFAFGFIKNMDEADEIAQNVFMKIWINRESLSSAHTLSSYIFTITKNEVHDYFRSNSYSLLYQEMMQEKDESIEYEIESEYNIKEIKEIVRATVQTMPEQRKLIFKLSREQFLSNDEIAEQLSISKRTVEKHISLALRTIKENLGDFMFWLFLFFLR